MTDEIVNADSIIDSIRSDIENFGELMWARGKAQNHVLRQRIAELEERLRPENYTEDLVCFGVPFERLIEEWRALKDKAETNAPNYLIVENHQLTIRVEEYRSFCEKVYHAVSANRRTLGMDDDWKELEEIWHITQSDFYDTHILKPSEEEENGKGPVA